MTSVVAALTLLLPGTPPERPRDVWVFRSVLDRHARMVTLALAPDIWVAYDATHARLYKVWRGKVNFDGAVYTTSHGPQPTTTGVAYLQGNPEATPWRWNGKPIEPRFRGYRFVDGQCRIQLDFSLGGNTARVYETPEITGDTFTRTVIAEGLPTGDLSLVLDETQSAITNPVPITLRVQNRVATTVTYQLGALPPESGHGPYPTLASSEDAAPTPREPGLAVRTYAIGQDMTQLPVLVGGQTPNRSFVAAKVDFKTAADFQAPPDQFLVHITGYMNVPAGKGGVTMFRLTSDDGAVFWIRDTKVVDHDGLNSGTRNTGSFTLDAGEHPIRIEYFENGGDELLKLEWRRLGEADWSVVPASAFTTDAGEVRVTSPGDKAIIASGVARRPGDRRPLVAVHPAFDLATVRPETFRPRVGGIDFLPNRDMVICNWEPDGGVYTLSDVEGPNPKPTVKRIAFGLAEPLGIKAVGKRIFVLQKQELTELIDHDGDGVTDEYLAVANGWGVTANFHEFAFGLVYQNGKFYAALATAIESGGASTHPQNPDRGKVVEIDLKTGAYKLIAHGLRTPNGIGFGYNGQMYVADNQGDWLPSSKIVRVMPGAFYGSHSVDPVGTADEKEFAPVVWLPQGEIGNSPSQPAPLNVGPCRNQMIHGDVTHGGVKRVFAETVDGVIQGAVFRFTQGLEAGVNRIAWGPDGALYVGGIGSAGNWGQEGKERYGLQRLTYNGKTAFEMLAVRAKTNGMELEFTEPLGPGEESDMFEMRTWRYVPTPEYGGPKVDEQDVAIKSVTVSPDRRHVFLEVPNLAEGHVLYIHLDPMLKSSSGASLWSTEAWYTLTKRPRNALGSVQPTATTVNQLTAAERAEGFTLLFDGRTTNGFVGFRQSGLPAGWSVRGGALTLSPQAGGGDLRTAETYGDFDLRWEWKVAPGGNSGVFYRATEEGDVPYATGPEYQLLDNERHPDGRNLLTSAGSNYGLYATDAGAVRPAGRWNRSRIVVRGNHVEHWLNGAMVVTYELGSPEWTAKVAASKFAEFPNYGKRAAGYVVFQNHGDVVSLRSVRIRRLP